MHSTKKPKYTKHQTGKIHPCFKQKNTNGFQQNIDINQMLKHQKNIMDSNKMLEGYQCRSLTSKHKA